MAIGVQQQVNYGLTGWAYCLARAILLAISFHFQKKFKKRNNFDKLLTQEGNVRLG